MFGKKEKEKFVMDMLLVIYYYYEVVGRCVVGNLVKDILVFLWREFFFGDLVDMM